MRRHVSGSYGDDVSRSYGDDAVVVVMIKWLLVGQFL